MPSAATQHPGGVSPGAEGHWQVGDNFFSTSVTIRYRLTNGDQVQLNALAEKGNRAAPLSCGWTELDSSPRAYDRAVNWVSGGVTGEGVIQLRVLPVRKAAGADAQSLRAAAARRCDDRSALIGTTTNETGVPLRLVSARYGAADGWCRALGQSQAPHSAGRWKLGGPRSGASVRFVYRLPDGDSFEFAATVDPRGGETGCAPIDHAEAARFGCRAVRTVRPHSEAPQLDFQVFRIRPGMTPTSARATDAARP